MNQIPIYHFHDRLAYEFDIFRGEGYVTDEWGNSVEIDPHIQMIYLQHEDDLFHPIYGA